MPRSLKRIRLLLQDGEPFDEITFDSREYDRYFAAQRDTHALFQRLKALVRERKRTTVEETEKVETEDTAEVPFHLADDWTAEEENLAPPVQR